MADDRTYIKLHDGMPGHPKIQGLSDKAFRTLIRAWCYCSEYLTDGVIVAAAARTLGSKKTWDEMVSACIAEDCPGGYLMHDYLEHQRSADDVRLLKERRREAGRKGGKAKASALASASPVARDLLKQTPSKDVAETETESFTNVKDGSAVADDHPRADVQALCDHLRRRVIANGSRVNVTAKWRDAARLLLDRDQRTPAEAHALIDWSQDSEFWRANVQSMPKFREKYDTLRLQAQSSRSGLRIATVDGERTWTLAELEAVLGPDMWTCPQPPRDLTPDQMWDWEQGIKREHRAERIAAAERKQGRAS